MYSCGRAPIYRRKNVKSKANSTPKENATAKNPESAHSTANAWRKISSTKQP